MGGPGNGFGHPPGPGFGGAPAPGGSGFGPAAPAAPGGWGEPASSGWGAPASAPQPTRSGGWMDAGDGEGWAGTPPAANSGNGWLGDTQQKAASGAHAAGSSWLGDNTPPTASARPEPQAPGGASFELHTHTVPVDVGTAWANSAVSSGGGRGGGAGAWVAIFLLLVAVGGGAFYVFTRPQKATTMAGTPGATATPTDYSALTPDAFYKTAKKYYAEKKYEQAAREANDVYTMFKATKGTSPAKLKEVSDFVKKTHLAYGKKTLTEANKFFAQKNYNKALNVAQQAVDILQKGNAPKQEIAKAYALLARSYKKVGNLADAEKFFKTAMSLSPGGPYGAELNAVRDDMAPDPVAEEVSAPTIEQPSLGDGGPGYQQASRRYGSGGGSRPAPQQAAPAPEPARRQNPAATYVPKPKQPSRRSGGPSFYNTPNKFGRY